MTGLSYLRRVQRLERRRLVEAGTCPDHLPAPTAARTVDYRDGLAALSPDAGERAEAGAAAAIVQAAPPCAACGWRPPAPISVRAVDWNSHTLDDHRDVR